ncbi:hypothetical protein SADUNF_Sadunf11G0092100 [Salix dunnii]|uniref:Protein kinase domain-containing protein n=1 Tax=Salix dunnii TaxID=1413687 RepID=A0A835JNX4_9ROSI|nr:hypothetical protein SADUNF_Sadunf11G0092100 [Salix dunnii]
MKYNWQEDMELPVFDISTIAHATDTFSDGNKLGEGGFGPVYKGILTGGQQIAVKRLSKSSGQGLDEFKNEVMLIAKLQHRNLVKLLGTPLELIDECLAESSNSSEIIRCIHVALLCVRQRPEDRPNMSAVVVILGSDMPLPQPKQPGFFMGENPYEQSTSSNKHEPYSGDEVSMMSLEPR